MVDAGPLFAAIDANDAHHDVCAELLQTLPGPLVVPVLVITEVAHVVSTRLGPQAEVRFLADLAVGALTVEPVRPSDWLRVAELVWRYRDLPLGTVDASVAATAERLNVDRIVTLDRRHFTVVRPAHVERFELLPLLD